MSKVGFGLMIVLASSYAVHAGVDTCGLINGSFEDDGRINDITAREPNGWDVNAPAGGFAGYVHYDWLTDGLFNLTMYADWLKTFTVDQTATVSQQLVLSDVNDITFDLKLETYTGSLWDPNVCTPVLMIDQDVVWQPMSSKPDIRGQYRGQTYTVEDKYRDDKPHKLSLGIRVKVADMLLERYTAHWDSIKCEAFCGGGGLLKGDLNRDCYVDIQDFALAAQTWLDPTEPQHPYNLSHADDQLGHGGTLDLFDFALYASAWQRDFADLLAFSEKWLQQVDLTDAHNLFKQDDVQPSAVVNFFDLAILADNWGQTSYMPQQ